MRGESLKSEIDNAVTKMARTLYSQMYGPHMQFGSIVRMGPYEYEIVETRREFMGLEQWANSSSDGPRPFKLRMLHTVHRIFEEAHEKELELIYE